MVFTEGKHRRLRSLRVIHLLDWDKPISLTKVCKPWQNLKDNGGQGYFFLDKSFDLRKTMCSLSWEELRSSWLSLNSSPSASEVVQGAWSSAGLVCGREVSLSRLLTGNYLSGVPNGLLLQGHKNAFILNKRSLWAEITRILRKCIRSILILDLPKLNGRARL